MGCPRAFPDTRANRRPCSPKLGIVAALFSLTLVVRDLVISPRPRRSRARSGVGLRTLARLAAAPISRCHDGRPGCPSWCAPSCERGLAIPPDRRRTPQPGSRCARSPDLSAVIATVRDCYLSLLTASMDGAVAATCTRPSSTCSAISTVTSCACCSRWARGARFRCFRSRRGCAHGGASRIELRHFSLLGIRAAATTPIEPSAYIDNLARVAWSRSAHHA